MQGARAWLILAAPLCACGPSTASPDGGALDAAVERNVPPLGDGGEAGVTGPAHLADTGLYSDFASRTLAPGVIEYTPRYPMWSDGALNKRYFWLPPNTKIDTSSMDDWVFPVDTKAWEDFTVDGKLLETRLLWKVDATQWWEVAYAWAPDGSDATAVPEGVADAQGTTHEILNQGDCFECHSDVSDVLIGVSALQLGASDGDGTLAKLAAAGSLSVAPAAAYDAPGTGVAKDALGYLHANCGHCHNARSGLKYQSAMRLNLSVTEAAPEKTAIYQTSLLLKMRHEIPPDLWYALLPGRPDQSGIVNRLARRDAWGMPSEGTVVVDDAGVALVSEWIASMPCGGSCASAPAPY